MKVTSSASAKPDIRRFGARYLGVALIASLSIGYSTSSAHAADLNAVRAQVLQLQQEATSIAESAQQAQVEMNNLNRQLSSVQNQAAADQATVSQYQKSLGAIAAEQYKNGGLGQGMQLLFSSNPQLYLDEAGALEIITKKKSLELKSYSVAKQRLQATSLVVGDKLALAKAAHDRFVARQLEANKKLAQVQTLLNSLTKAEQERLAALAASQDSADTKYSLEQAAKANLGSGRGATALRYAIKQIGDRYVFGAAGPVYWDCSGLTMRSFAQAGVGLPHSAAYQYSFGRSIARNALQAGDLVFFGRPIDHVGIYLGGGEMVDAPHAGARVRVEPFGSYFGRLPYVGARRI